HSHPGDAPAPGASGARPGGVLAVAMGYHYNRGAVVGTDPDGPVVPERMQLSADPGTRAPHMWIGLGGERKSTIDLYERSFVLLSSEGTPWRAAAQEVAEQLGMRLDAYAIGIGAEADVIPENGADWAEVHGTHPEGAVLVRPDGFVAWRWTQAVEDPQAVLHEVMSTLLGRS
ncbi:aromatic-ring hydroxylase C-terminal domain-containing protein, partial [Streptomyces xanthophaeus]